MFEGGKATGLLMGICIVAIGLLGWKNREGGLNELLSLVEVSWLPLVLTIRLIEGVSIGNVIRGKLGVWLPFALIIPLVGAAYITFYDVHVETIVYLKTLLMVLGAITASLFLIGKLKNTDFASESDSTFIGISMFLTFCSASLYITTNATLFAIYTYLFPVGVISGILFGKKVFEEVV